MNLEEAVAIVASYGPRELPAAASTGQRGGRGGRRSPVVVTQEVIVGWWQLGAVKNRRATIEGLDGEAVVFRRADSGKRWACPIGDLIYVRRWPEN